MLLDEELVGLFCDLILWRGLLESHLNFGRIMGEQFLYTFKFNGSDKFYMNSMFSWQNMLTETQ
jgi:late competence protein required for DNA uptake (superfamily II DNA/RNA helicase)